MQDERSHTVAALYASWSIGIEAKLGRDDWRLNNSDDLKPEIRRVFGIKTLTSRH